MNQLGPPLDPSTPRSLATPRIDLDVEGGGSAHYAAFVTQLRAHASGASKKYYVTAAPQCPFPDANLGAVINAVGFDAVYVQFCESLCCSVSRALGLSQPVFESLVSVSVAVVRLGWIGYVLSELETCNWNWNWN